MGGVSQIQISLVYPGEGGRALDRSRVGAIAESIKDIGLRTPITVRPMTKVADGREIAAYEIVTGWHRYEAACQIGMETIAAIVSDDDDLHAELWQIDENLCRVDLSPADRADAVARRKVIYETLHPETRHGAIGGGHDQSRKLCDSAQADRFTANTSKATGKSERSVQLDADRGEKIDPDVLKEIRGTRWDRGTNLDILKKLTHAEQRQALFRVKNGVDPTFEAAFDLIRGDVPTRKPVQPPAAPLNDMEVFNQQLARLISAWNAAGADVRQHFVERYIDTPVMDRGAA